MVKLCLSLLLACVLCHAAQAEDRAMLLRVYEEQHASPRPRTLQQIEKDLRRSRAQQIYDGEQYFANLEAQRQLEDKIGQRMEAEEPVLCGVNIREPLSYREWRTLSENCEDYKVAWARHYLYFKSLAGPQR
jgi:hypothetical protein